MLLLDYFRDYIISFLFQNLLGVKLSYNTSDVLNSLMTCKVYLTDNKFVDMTYGFMVDDEWVVVLADVPHLLKSMRNALYNNKIITIDPEIVKEHNLPSDKVHWAAIEDVAYFQKWKEFKIAPKLKKEYLNLTSWAKMNVPPAMAVLSRETAAAIELLVEKYDRPKEWLTTAFFCKAVDDWHSFMNNREISCAFRQKSPEHNIELVSFLRWFVRFYCTMKLHKNQKGGLKPSQRGVMLSTASIIHLQKELLDKGYSFVLTARFTNNCIENLFSVVRRRCSTPNCLLFKRILKGIALSQFLRKVRGSSYEDDEGVSFITGLKELKLYHDMQDMEWQIAETEVAIPVDKKLIPQKRTEQQENEAYFEAHQCQLEQSEYWSFVHYSGYILRKTILSQSECDICGNYMVTNEVTNKSAYELINKRDYKVGALTRPTQAAIQIFQYAEANFKHLRGEMQGSKTFSIDLTNRIIKNINEKMENVPQCHLKLIVSRWVRGRIHHFAKYTKEQTLLAQAEEMSTKERASKTASRKAQVH